MWIFLTFRLCITDVCTSRVIEKIANLEFASEDYLARFRSNTLELKCCVRELHFVRCLEVGWIHSTDDVIWTLIRDDRKLLISCCLCHGTVFDGESKSLNRQYLKIDESFCRCNRLSGLDWDLLFLMNVNFRVTVHFRPDYFKLQTLDGEFISIWKLTGFPIWLSALFPKLVSNSPS